MRLIDVDALNLDYEVDMADDWKTAHEIANHIRYAPTVEAIPIEFIEKQAKYADDLMTMFGIPASLVANEYRFLIEEWKKENENNVVY